MKKWPFAFALLFGFLVFSACSKEYKFKKKNMEFTAIIDGDLFMADSIFADGVSGNVLPPGGGFAGYAIYAGGPNLALPQFYIFLSDTDPGSYPVSNLAGGPTSALIFFSRIMDGDTIDYPGVSGTLTIEEFNGDIGGGIKGIFNCIGESDQQNSISITDGSFEISFN